MTPRDKLIEDFLSENFKTPDDEFRHFHLDEGNLRHYFSKFIDHLKLEVVDNNIIYGLEHCVPKKPIINIDNL